MNYEKYINFLKKKQLFKEYSDYLWKHIKKIFRMFS